MSWPNRTVNINSHANKPVLSGRNHLKVYCNEDPVLPLRPSERCFTFTVFCLSFTRKKGQSQQENSKGKQLFHSFQDRCQATQTWLRRVLRMCTGIFCLLSDSAQNRSSHLRSNTVCAVIRSEDVGRDRPDAGRAWRQVRSQQTV